MKANVRDARGQKRRRVGGSTRPLNGLRSPAQAAKGNYINPRIIKGSGLNARQSPLGAYARKLLTQYLRRSAFMKAVDQLKFTIESAADIYLHVKKRQAQNIYEETSAVGGAYQWFLVEVAKGYQNGKIASGRDTEPCPLADRFFLLISDRETCEDAVGKALGARSVVDEVDIDDAMSHLNFLGKQTAGYMIFKTALAANSSPGRD